MLLAQISVCDADVINGAWRYLPFWGQIS